MEEYSESKEFKIEKQEIISRIPLLQAFLDPHAEDHPDKYMTTLANELSDTLKEIDANFESDFLDLGISPLAIMAKTLGFFSTEDPETQLTITVTLASIGYRLERPEDAYKFEEDIVMQLLKLDIITKPTDEKDMLLVSNVALGMLYSGCLWRGPISKDKDNKEDNLKVFRDFFEGHEDLLDL